MKKYRKIIHYLIILGLILFGVITQDLLATLKLGLFIMLILLLDNIFTDKDDNSTSMYI